MNHFFGRVEVNRHHIDSRLLAVHIIEAGNVEVFQRLDGVTCVPREEALAEMKASQVASLAVRFCFLEEAADLLNTASSSQEFNQLRECVEVIRILFK